MKKLILISILSAFLFMGCKTEEKENIFTETVKISGSISYYLSECNYTIVDYRITDYDINSNGIVVVTYSVDENGFPLPLKIEDDKI